ncbi:MAG: chromatin modification- protein VID21 [Chaenotheca gracillima]|nr:MAG: chromatin modification- protein VID21 [Chaenotheca gracillima]
MSASSGNRLPNAVKGGVGTTPTPANGGTSSRRRSSGGSNQGLFSGLVAQKRNSTDAAANARKASFNEQQPKPGFLGSMWHNFTKGNPNAAAGAASQTQAATAK